MSAADALRAGLDDSLAKEAEQVGLGTGTLLVLRDMLKADLALAIEPLTKEIKELRERVQQLEGLL